MTRPQPQPRSSRGWGKTRQARDAYEAAVAQGEHAHWWGRSGTECGNRQCEGVAHLEKLR